MKMIKRFLVHLFMTSIGRVFPDAIYLRIMYYINMHKHLNLNRPKTFNEKLQWLKLHDRKKEYTMMVDKYEVKKYVASKLGNDYIIPTLGIWKRFEEIDFDSLPNKFVLKCTHDSGSVIICRNKAEFDIEGARKKINYFLKQRHYWLAREWPYKNVKPRIIAEKYMEDREDKELIDYKWFCFNGVPKFLYISQGLENHATATIDFYDIEHNKMPFKRRDFKGSTKIIPKPQCHSEMINIAKQLSVGIPFVRIDLYEINGKVYFSEITFSPCAGWLPFEPPEWDERLGEYIDLRNEL